MIFLPCGSVLPEETKKTVFKIRSLFTRTYKASGSLEKTFWPSVFLDFTIPLFVV